MKVLHVYNHDIQRLAIYVDKLIQAMPERVECAKADNAADMYRICHDFRPDIIHQHGMPLGKIPAKTRLIISPHGETPCTDRAFVVITRSPYEHSRQKCQRIEMVKDPLITTTIDFHEAAKSITTIYQRVMDSQPLQLMNKETRHALATMLKIAICGDKRWTDYDTLMTSISDINFRLLYIYAQLEGVLDLVEKGIGLLGIDAPGEPSIDNFLPENYRKPKAMQGATIVQQVQDIADGNGITLLRLAEITQALHDDRLDEESLTNEIEEKKLKPLFQSILQILCEQTLLTEGFMPMPPLNNKETALLRNQLENNLRIL